MSTSERAVAGEARSSGLSYQDLLDRDTHPVPATLREQSALHRGHTDVSIDRYISAAWHTREMQGLWQRVWQFACREEHIPNSGDYHVYDIGHLSFIVLRDESGTVRAFVNACLHRGRQLKHYDGYCSELRCPYHGFAWHLDGRLKDVPARWDFPHIEDAKFSLPEVAVGLWAGFVFINPDPELNPADQTDNFARFIGGLARHFERWDLASRYVEVHIAKNIRANWKIAQEAFCEAFHVNATHPQGLPYLGDTNSQVDVWDTFSRVITPGGTPSPLLDWDPTEEDMLRHMLDIRMDEPLPWSVADVSARHSAAASARGRWREVVGDVVDTWSDAEFIDNLDYTLFPNFHPWGAFNRIVYRFRPNGNDHRSSIMEVLYLSPFKGDRPPPAQVHHLGPDQPWTDATELGMLAKIFEQDTFNMERVQVGLETTRKPGVTLGNYQELRVRWLNELMDAYLDRYAPADNNQKGNANV